MRRKPQPRRCAATGLCCEQKCLDGEGCVLVTLGAIDLYGNHDHNQDHNQKESTMTNDADIQRYDDESARMARETRKLPPMSQMTRIQKRYFLEPWWTVGWVGSWLISLFAFIPAIFTPWHVEFAMLGLLFLLAGAAFGATKLWVAEWNQETEGRITASTPRGHEPGCRCTRCY